MNNCPDSLRNLIESFKMLPGIGEKTAERFAFSILDMDSDDVNFFSKCLQDVKIKIKKCSVCNNITEKDVCDICNDNERNNIICVVESPKNILFFEKSGIYHGKYHTLDGLISPINGINPDDINIKSLLTRLENNNIDEIIFALKPGIEGETTVLYISKILAGMNIKISKVAQGLPIGADMDYIDSLTLEMAIKDRKTIE